ncbi:hypothetical protein ACIA5D_36735 [Actinoplanes sp. NPDC051513]|uniref:hypothetical protein n=1 Tax=Actinoplanes sp. NPDC051513 TaxID=3363908 RepID=UPI00379AECFB
MSGSLTADKASRIEKIVCPAHSEILIVAGMPVSEVIAWTRDHAACDVTVVLAEKRTLLDTVRALAEYEETS